mmetsp:Transcript_25313/g.78018  ORF Transcript_25313/g.78018 Transcript_25313/m.78018 type:complete len:313 (+) Transcript_25313:176-1114(+)
MTRLLCETYEEEEGGERRRGGARRTPALDFLDFFFVVVLAGREVVVFLRPEVVVFVVLGFGDVALGLLLHGISCAVFAVAPFLFDLGALLVGEDVLLLGGLVFLGRGRGRLFFGPGPLHEGGRLLQGDEGLVEVLLGLLVGEGVEESGEAALRESPVVGDGLDGGGRRVVEVQNAMRPRFVVAELGPVAGLEAFEVELPVGGVEHGEGDGGVHFVGVAAHESVDRLSQRRLELDAALQNEKTPRLGEALFLETLRRDERDGSSHRGEPDLAHQVVLRPGRLDLRDLDPIRDENRRHVPRVQFPSLQNRPARR